MASPKLDKADQRWVDLALAASADGDDLDRALGRDYLDFRGAGYVLARILGQLQTRLDAAAKARAEAEEALFSLTNGAIHYYDKKRDPLTGEFPLNVARTVSILKSDARNKADELVTVRADRARYYKALIAIRADPSRAAELVAAAFGPESGTAN